MVARVRKVYHLRAVGHTGTLDPFATGLLVMLLGKATRLARFVEQQPKTYLATARLGVRTTTDDDTGEVVGAEAAGTADVTVAAVRASLTSFVGDYLQRPPAYSAKKVGGERSYRLARRGAISELPEVAVTVYSAELLGYEPPAVTFRTTVSPGTYIRALARDLGDRLGVGAHLTALRRERIGQLSIHDAVPLAQLSADTPVLPPLAAVGHLPAVELTEAEVREVAQGKAVRRSLPDSLTIAGSSAVRVVMTRLGEVIAVAEADGEWLRPRVVLESA